MSILAQLYNKYGKQVVTSFEDINTLIEPNNRRSGKVRILMVGGSEKYPGALIMSGLAALRTGVHGVILIAPEVICRNVPVILPSGFITLNSDKKNILFKELEKMISKWEVVALLGPGIENNEKNQNFITQLIELFLKNKIPMVLDANVLDMILETSFINKLKNQQIALTPNSDELSRIVKYYNLQLPSNFLEKVEFVKNLAKQIGVVICAKGRRDIITDGNQLKINYAGDAIMSAANCGDVLSGLIVSFLSESRDLFKASVAGTFVAGRAGNLSFAKKGFSFVAYDLLESLEEFIKMSSMQTLINEVRLSKNTFDEDELEI